MFLKLSRERVMDFVDNYLWYWAENDKRVLIVSTSEREDSPLFELMSEGMEPERLGYAKVTDEYLKLNEIGLDTNLKALTADEKDLIFSIPSYNADRIFGDSDDKEDYADNVYDIVLVDGLMFDLSTFESEDLLPVPYKAVTVLIED